MKKLLWLKWHLLLLSLRLSLHPPRSASLLQKLLLTSPWWSLLLLLSLNLPPFQTLSWLLLLLNLWLRQSSNLLLQCSSRNLCRTAWAWTLSWTLLSVLLLLWLPLLSKLLSVLLND